MLFPLILHWTNRRNGYTNADKKALNIHVPPDLASVFEAGAILKNSDKKRGQKGVRFLRRAVWNILY